MSFFQKIFQRQPMPATAKTVEFAISGMHCTSCALNIDGDLEDIAGVISATTKYTDGRTMVVYDPAVVSVAELKKQIGRTGYTVQK